MCSPVSYDVIIQLLESPFLCCPAIEMTRARLDSGSCLEKNNEIPPALQTSHSYGELGQARTQSLRRLSQPYHPAWDCPPSKQQGARRAQHRGLEPSSRKGIIEFPTAPAHLLATTHLKGKGVGYTTLSTGQRDNSSLSHCHILLRNGADFDSSDYIHN